MAEAQERPRITEIQVRIDCNGCVQKIKKALQGINGISDVYIDLPQQKLTIIGCADPERIIKAIKKARKNAKIYSCSEVQEPPPSQPTGPTPQDNETPPDQPQPSPDQPQPEQQPPTQENPTTQPPPPENPNTNEPPPPPINPNEPQNQNPHNEVVEEVHVIHHHPPDYSNRPRGYSHGYDRGYTTEEPHHSQSYNPGPRVGHNPRYDFSQGYEPGYSPAPRSHAYEPDLSQGFDPGYNPEPRSQRYEPGYNSGPRSQRYEPIYESRPRSHGYEPSYSYEPPRQNQRHGYGGEWSGRPEPSYRPEIPQPIQVTHSYNQYRPQPNVTQYEYVPSPPNATQYVQTPPNATQYEYVHSPPRFTPYARSDNYYYYNSGDYQNDNNNNNSNGYMSSMFSEENPNACTIS